MLFIASDKFSIEGFSLNRSKDPFKKPVVLIKIYEIGETILEIILEFLLTT